MFGFVQRTSVSRLYSNHFFKQAQFLMSARSSFSSSSGENTPTRRKSTGPKIYTKTGDKGTSTLYNMERISKSSDFFAALGDTDELNGFLGLAAEYCRLENNTQLPPWLDEIQSRLMDAGACIATPLSSSPERKIYRTAFDEKNIATLEAHIDEMTENLPPLRQFILPSGGLASSTLHIARSVCRRAERSTVDLVARGDLEPVVMQYLNRLSDFLFVAARTAAQSAEKPETLYFAQKRIENESEECALRQKEHEERQKAIKAAKEKTLEDPEAKKSE